MKNWNDYYTEEHDSIKNEVELRESVSKISGNFGLKFFEISSLLFLIAGFITLVMCAFTEVTLLNVTCLFVISHVLAPTDMDFAKGLLNGVSINLAVVRLNTAIIAKKLFEKDA